MPRIKLDYVVSFSSEDSDNKADNLLNWDVSKKKWLCCRGEPSSSVVLQLKSCTQISSVTIGVYHAALVEVLVGLSEKPNNPYEVLVPSSIFVNPIESRKSDNIERVRSFTTDQLCEGVRSKRWDRLRVVCSQPYNKHCQYGLSFVHIFSPDDTSPAAPAPLTASNPITLPTYSSDEDEFKPGELFALHRQSQGESSNTDAQIRQASSQAIKNISDTATKLVKTPITKPSTKTQAHNDENPSKDRQRNNLIYTEDDAEPHAKIDRIVQRHNDEKIASKSKENETKDKKRERHKTDDSRLDRSVTDSKNNKNKQDKKERDSKTDTRMSDKDERQSNSSEKVKNTPSTSRDVASTSKNKDGEKNNLKRTYTDRKDVDTDLIPGPKSSSPHTLFKNVVFAISGYENPRRANIRSTALAMGASYKQNWTPECTHLICAFSNTPKLKTVRSHPEGHRCTVVTGEWVEECSVHMRLLPWQWYATEQSKKVERKWTGDEEEDRSGNNEDMDTDDEIERVVQQQKRRKTDQNENRTSDKKISDNNVEQNDNIQDDVMQNDNIQDNVMLNDILQDEFKKNETDIEDIKNKSSDSDVAFVRDERIQGNITVQDSDIESDTPTDIEEGTTPNRPTQLDHSKALPDLFQGMTFHLSPNMTAEDKVLIDRYLTAYGGVVIENSVDEEQAADYTICTDVEDYTETDTAQNSRQCVRADWVWQCHEQKTRCGVEEFLLEGREVK